MYLITPVAKDFPKLPLSLLILNIFPEDESSAAATATFSLYEHHDPSSSNHTDSFCLWCLWAMRYL